MTEPPTPPPADLGTPKPPPPDPDLPTPPPMNPNQPGGTVPPDPGTGKEHRPALSAADTYEFGNREHFDQAMSEIDELHKTVLAAREFAIFVMTKDRTWPEAEAEVRLIHEECHWHMEHDHSIVI